MGEQKTVRLLLALSAHFGWHVGHFYITAAYLHEKYTDIKPVFIQEDPRFIGERRHPHDTVVFFKNLYGTPSGAFTYQKA